jgi:hypothetical protein
LLAICKLLYILAPSTPTRRLVMAKKAASKKVAKKVSKKVATKKKAAKRK